MTQPQRPTVLLIIPHLGRGGAQQVFRDQLALYQQHANVIGCVFSWSESFEHERQPPVISLGVEGSSHAFGKIWSFWKRIHRLRKLKKKYRVDVAISHLEGADYINILSSRGEHIVLWVHATKKFDQDIESRYGWVRKKLLIPYLYRKATRIVTVSERIRLELIHDFDATPKKVRTIYNGVPIRQIGDKASERVPLPFDASVPILVTHCRLAPQKNLSAMIEIFAEVKKKHLVRLMILGDGELRQSLMEQSKELGLASYSIWEPDPIPRSADIYWMGHHQNPYPYLHAAALYIMTSDWEGFPLSLCEAMACGLPVIACDCPTGPREILAPAIDLDKPIDSPYPTSCGVLMPLANSSTREVWANNIGRLVEDENLRISLGQEAAHRASSFDLKITESHWLDLLNFSTL